MRRTAACSTSDRSFPRPFCNWRLGLGQPQLQHSLTHLIPWPFQFTPFNLTKSQRSIEPGFFSSLLRVQQRKWDNSPLLFSGFVHFCGFLFSSSSSSPSYNCHEAESLKVVMAIALPLVPGWSAMHSRDLLVTYSQLVGLTCANTRRRKQQQVDEDHHTLDSMAVYQKNDPACLPACLPAYLRIDSRGESWAKEKKTYFTCIQQLSAYISLNQLSIACLLWVAR